MLLGMGCKKPRDNSFILYHVHFDYLGSKKNGFCDFVLDGKLSPTAKNWQTYKVINLSDTLLRRTADRYTATVAIHPTKPKCHCQDETVDMPDGEPFHSYDLQYILIMDIKKD